ncbi:MAG: 16S rRNA (guanine(966)-N(2))-methyltransferase RsmD [endosymbiont of Seepiophila jonesi]|uniref:Ribosomal RNA small subunit methyltransferase D n=1 Tax=endosymbiont of Lamellibrachia luymesi TaxID=2200907 RepID=A0A370E0Y3_9GAMM|nr:MAG: 16S rRNA (guanine(966)-N(2))-methyltransferase RsmD [endosymbiont of Seepiophila jonesi]RDH91648.1 MAG: 16S rRNA (guanine(966)-N(2))-methyltransferase RsmD [endosymbiont of Lamellibrachia luymesi]
MPKRSPNQVRIIGGKHRGRKLDFPDLPGLRPTGDRVRETLFNWLQPLISGARCLDLFAGSGALGLEAASRGAGQVVILDSAVTVTRQLEANRSLLQLDQLEIVCANALEWLAEQRSSRPFDLVFLDPPFADDLLAESCRLLQSHCWLADNARIYLEDDAGRGLPALPEGWELLKEKRAGQVRYGLARFLLP